MSTVKSFKIGTSSIEVQDPKSMQVLTATDRATLLSSGTYRGIEVPTNTDFINADGKVENYTWHNENTVSSVATKSVSSVASFANGMCGSNGTYIVGDNNNTGKIMYTSDYFSSYSNITLPGSPSSFYIYTAYANGTYVATTSNALYHAKSTDGVNWTVINSSLNFWFDERKQLAYKNGYYYLTDGTNIQKSQDLETWTVALSNGSNYGFVDCEGTLIAFNNGGNYARYSTDGETWNQVSSPYQSIFDFRKAGNIYYLQCGSAPNYRIYKSTDLSTWSQVSIPFSFGNNDRMFSVGDILFLNNYTNSTTYYTKDGSTWSQIENFRAISPSNSDLVTGSIAATQLKYVTIGTQNIKSLTSKTYTKSEVDSIPTTYTGYDATATQTLKNVNGVLTWVTDS